MSGYLLDSNVVSEIIKPTPEPRVVSFVSEQFDLWLSVIVVHEAHYGLNIMPRGRRRENLSSAFAALVTEYGDRVLPVSQSAAEHAARLRVFARMSGRVINLADALIAGTAMTHGLTIATRNVKDFDGLGLDVFDPWQST